VHVVHAFLPAVQTLPFEAGGLEVALSGEAQNLHDEVVAREIARLAERVKIPARRRHVQMGDIADVLPKVVRKTRAAVVVMGAVSRSALRRFFIGNAAERVLDELTCDVLVVKNRGAAAGKPRATARRSVHKGARRRARP
jgi:universal stress protein E